MTEPASRRPEPKIGSCWRLDVLKKKTGTPRERADDEFDLLSLIEKLWSTRRHGTHLALHTLYSMKINP